MLDRVTDRQGAIGELPYAEISEARIHGVDPIPRLAELLAEFPEARFNIDAKSPTSVDLLADDHRAVRGVRPGLRELVRDPPAARAAPPARPSGPLRGELRGSRSTGSCPG